MKKFIGFTLAVGLIAWRAMVEPRLDLPTEVGTLEAIAHFMVGWFLCVWVCCPRLTDYYGNRITSSPGPCPIVPWPVYLPDCLIYSPGVLKAWMWLYQRQWFYFWAAAIPSLFELILVIYQIKNK